MKSPVSRILRIQRWLTFSSIALLIVPSGVSAQQVPSAPQGKPEVNLSTTQSLKVLVLAGAGETNDLGRRVMAPLVVQVLDQNDRPVEGADVVFRFPLKGPSATFADQKNSQTVRTDADGQAAANGWMANSEVGTFLAQVTASHGSEMGTASVSMTNATDVVLDGKTKHKSWWSSKTAKIIIIGAAAAAVATTVILLTRGGGSNTTTVTASPGSPTIGGPH